MRELFCILIVEVVTQIHILLNSLELYAKRKKSYHVII